MPQHPSTKGRRIVRARCGIGSCGSGISRHLWSPSSGSPDSMARVAAHARRTFSLQRGRTPSEFPYSVKKQASTGTRMRGQQTGFEWCDVNGAAHRPSSLYRPLSSANVTCALRRIAWRKWFVGGGSRGCEWVSSTAGISALS